MPFEVAHLCFGGLRVWGSFFGWDCGGLFLERMGPYGHEQIRHNTACPITLRETLDCLHNLD